ncbi:MFS general substrate transporter [Clavulina sp. PMI_390]|nr:MFS general substrate transporter [Clavulina sp. PMI_390]
MAGAHTYAGLMGTRFTLGLFEAACLPVFTMMVSNWYRRAEQPIRIAAFYSMNGIGTIVGSGIVYGLGHVKTTTLHTYQIVFLFFGLITCITAPFLYWKLDNSPESARFLSPEDRIKAVARLRSNQAAHSNEGTFEIKWSHVIEIVTEPKTIGWIGMTFLLNLGASVSSVFGPLILNGLGYSSYLTSLLNMPFGALQFILILSASYAAYSFKVKGPIFFVMMLPTLAGVAMLWGLGRTHSDQAPLLAAYYLIAFLFAGNPLLVSWITANTAGQTKKSIILALYQASSSAGNIAGPQLFHSKDKPEYKPGLKATMASFIVLVVLILLQIVGLMVLNKLKERQRVANGKPAKLVDLSMTHHFAQDAGQTEVEAGVDGRERMTHAEKAAALDMTDRQNDEFQYVL